MEKNMGNEMETVVIWAWVVTPLSEFIREPSYLPQPTKDDSSGRPAL